MPGLTVADHAAQAAAAWRSILAQRERTLAEHGLGGGHPWEEAGAEPLETREPSQAYATEPHDQVGGAGLPPMFYLAGNKRTGAKKSAAEQRADKRAEQEADAAQQAEINAKENTKNARPSTSDDHTRGMGRKRRDAWREKGDARRPYRRVFPDRLLLPPGWEHHHERYIPVPPRRPGESDEAYDARTRPFA